MDFKSKTSTYNLTNKKGLKKITDSRIYKKMDDLIGLRDFNESGKIIKSKEGYSVVMKISSTEPSLLADDDMEAFQDTLINTVYGLDFPIKTVRSNRKQNFNRYMEFIDRCARESNNSERLLRYKEELFCEFEKMKKGQASNAKANYIIVFSNKKDDDILALKELQDRVNYIARALSDTNFRVMPIGGLEMFEYVFFQFNKGLDIDLESFFENGSFTMVHDVLGGSYKVEKIDENHLMKLITEEQEKEALERKAIVDNMSEKDLKKYRKKQKKLEQKQKKSKKDDVISDELKMIAIQDIIKPDIYVEKADYIQLGTSSFIRMLAVDALPSSLNVRTLNLMNDIENMETHCHIEKQDETKLSKMLKNEYAKVSSNMQVNYKKTGIVDYAEQKLARHLLSMREAVETNTDKLYHIQILTKIWSDSLEDLEAKTKQLVESYSKRGMKLRVLFYDQGTAFKNTLPTGAFEFKESRFNLTTGGVSTLIPTGCTHLRHPEGRYVGRTIETKSPIILDPFICQKKYLPESVHYSNPNTFVSGKPGSGKSVFMKLDIVRSIPLGDIHVVIDPDQEYKNISKKADGHYVYLKNGIKSGLNPFELNVSYDEDTGEKLVPLDEKIGELSGLMNTFVSNYRQGRALSGIELPRVTEAIRQVYIDKGITTNPESLYTVNENGEKVKKDLPIFSDLKALLEDNNDDNIKEVAEMMKMITGNGVMSLFDCQTNTGIRDLLEKKLLIFSLKGLDDLGKTFTLTTLLSWLWGVFSDWKLRKLQKNIKVDEAWRLAKHKESLQYIENCIRRGRKYWIAIMLASQSIKEFTTTEEGEAILNFCSTKYIFRQDAALSKTITDFFGLPKSAAKRLPNFSKGQCIISTELGNVVAQVDLFKCEEDFATT